MNDGRFPAGWRFHFLLSSETLPLLVSFSHTKIKASEYEQLILASTPGKNLRTFRKDKQSFGDI